MMENYALNLNWNNLLVGLPLAPIAWLVYGSLMIVRVTIIFKFDLQRHEELADLKLIIWWVSSKKAWLLPVDNSRSTDWPIKIEREIVMLYIRCQIQS